MTEPDQMNLILVVNCDRCGQPTPVDDLWLVGVREINNPGAGLLIRRLCQKCHDPTEVKEDR